MTYNATDNGRKCYEVAIAALRLELERTRIVAAIKHHHNITGGKMTLELHTETAYVQLANRFYGAWFSRARRPVFIPMVG